MEEVTGILEVVADELWITWAEWVIPNMALWAREQVVAKECEEHTKKVHEKVA